MPLEICNGTARHRISLYVEPGRKTHTLNFTRELSASKKAEFPIMAIIVVLICRKYGITQRINVQVGSVFCVLVASSIHACKIPHNGGMEGDDDTDFLGHRQASAFPP